MRCLTGATFNMTATVLKPEGAPETAGGDATKSGHWTYTQDPTSGAIITKWITTTDDPLTDRDESGLLRIRCSVRGIIDGGIRVAGTTERFSDKYESVDWAKMTFPNGISITKRDRITNVRNAKGELVWTEEESTNSPTIFNVMGVTPVLDPFSRVLYNTALLERAEVQ